jgi:ribosomal protein S18 acetylase RimI-like enzyme
MSERETQSRVLRAARPAEYDLIGKITATVYVGDGFISPESPYVESLRDAASRAEKAELLVAELDGAIVGTVTYCEGGTSYSNLADPDEAEFRMLAVTGAARGAGVGAALVGFCVEKARAAGRTALRLSTQTDMLAAQRIYERMGFERTPERDWEPVPGYTLITYALAL